MQNLKKGLFKSQAIINRLNRWSGTNWKAETQKFERDIEGKIPTNAGASIYVSCTDTVASRFEIDKIIADLTSRYSNHRDSPRYWLDLGNTKYTGQGILSTVGKIEQPIPKNSKPLTRSPPLSKNTEQSWRVLEQEDDTPSCSLAESLSKQDLFINSIIAHLGGSLVWNLLKTGLTKNRGFFLNLQNFNSQPIPVGS